jgi:hypothetical protein
MATLTIDTENPTESDLDIIRGILARASAHLTATPSSSEVEGAVIDFLRRIGVNNRKWIYAVLDGASTTEAIAKVMGVPYKSAHNVRFNMGRSFKQTAKRYPSVTILRTDYPNGSAVYSFDPEVRAAIAKHRANYPA